MRARVAILGAVFAGILVSGAGAAQGVSGPPAAVAPAKLAYLSGRDGQQVWLANADGTGRRRLGSGEQPLLSPDGAQVAASLSADTGSALAIYRPGSPTRRYFNAAKVNVNPVAWSPLGQYLAVELFDSVGNGAGLAIVDTKTNTVKTIATGSICGASFAPDLPDRLVYGRGSAHSLCVGAGVDVFSAAVDGSGRTQLTHDGHSLYPVWGAGRIAFDREKLRRRDAPIFQIWLMDPDGTHRVQLTHTKVPSLLEGLVPRQFSADGERLLAEYAGQDTSETWTIDIRTGKARHLLVRRQDVSPGGLSLDGSTVLVDVGGFENPPSAGTIATIPFTGGPAKVLVKHAGAPTWNK